MWFAPVYNSTVQRTFSSVLGHPGCFHLLAIVKRTALTTNAACISLGDTARSKGSFSFRFVCFFEEPAYWLPQQLHESGAAPGMREHPESFQHSAPADTESSASLIQPSHWAPHWYSQVTELHPNGLLSWWYLTEVRWESHFSRQLRDAEHF